MIENFPTKTCLLRMRVFVFIYYALSGGGWSRCVRSNEHFPRLPYRYQKAIAGFYYCAKFLWNRGFVKIDRGYVTSDKNKAVMSRDGGAYELCTMYLYVLFYVAGH